MNDVQLTFIKINCIILPMESIHTTSIFEITPFNSSSSAINEKENFFSTKYFVIMVVGVILFILLVIGGTIAYILITQKDDTISPHTKRSPVPNNTPLSDETNDKHKHGKNCSEFEIALQNFNRNQQNDTPVQNSASGDLNAIEEGNEVNDTGKKKTLKYITVNTENTEQDDDKMDDDDDESSLSIHTSSEWQEQDENDNIWICPLCTYRNHTDKPNCDMCRTPQPIVIDEYDDNNNERPIPKFQVRIKP
eukprot:UN11154